MRYIANAIADCLKSDLSSVPGSGHFTFALEYQSREIVRKLVPVDSREVDNQTFTKFKECNDLCRRWVPSSDPSMVFLEYARSFIHSLFDLDSDFNVNDILGGVNLGPGANIGGHESCSYPLKLHKGLSGRANLLRLYDTACSASGFRLYVGPDRNAVEHSNVSFVPKTDSSSRMICTEPTVNMLFQRGVSSVIERALLRCGIDLSTQPAKNADYARRGSLTGAYATIDLSSASDSISLALARFLLPQRMLSWITSTRSRFTKYNDEVIDLAMVSTMGNGYTFSLQTLIFYAIARSCAGMDVHVFGDDIIVPTNAVHRVLKVLNLAGFTPNEKKTFVTGSFRESCGSDYYNGINVRPHYIKSLKTPQDLCVHINRIRRWANAHHIGHILVHTEELFRILIARFRLISTAPFENDDAGIHDLPCPRATLHLDRSEYWLEANGHRPVYFYYAYRYKPESLVFFGDGSLRGAYARACAQVCASNPDLMVSSFMRGSIRDNRLTFRPRGHEKLKYNLVRTYTTNMW